ncbi:unnamed protein product [Paramecium pentaurelia]|uniref:Uncharacterized protein n=1 Tax=Paramecium pentaurelia TaxID=43138 RepID=A0A8S1TKW1_9CILI|nr:unnamed protein product [Paramecium pentaurelia]
MNNYSCQEYQTPCLNCTINANYCLSCVDDTKYILEQNLCNCRDGYYFNDNLCLKFSPQFQTSVNASNKCLKCSDTNQSIFKTNASVKFDSTITKILNVNYAKLNVLAVIHNKIVLNAKNNITLTIFNIFEFIKSVQILNKMFEWKIGIDMKCYMNQTGTDCFCLGGLEYYQQYLIIMQQFKDLFKLQFNLLTKALLEVLKLLYIFYTSNNIADCKPCVNQSDNCTFVLRHLIQLIINAFANKDIKEIMLIILNANFHVEFVFPNKFVHNVFRSNILFLKRILVFVIKVIIYLITPNVQNAISDANHALHKLNAQIALLNRILQNNDCICYSEQKARKIANIKILLINNGHMEKIVMMDIKFKEMDVLIIKQILITNVSIKYLNLQFFFQFSDDCNQCDFNNTLNSTICTQCVQLYFIQELVCLNVLNNFDTLCRLKLNNQGQCQKCKDIVKILLVYSLFLKITYVILNLEIQQ